MFCGCWFPKQGCFIIYSLKLSQDFWYSWLLFWVEYYYFLRRKLSRNALLGENEDRRLALLSFLTCYFQGQVSKSTSFCLSWTEPHLTSVCLSISSFTCGLSLAVWLCSANLGTNVCTWVCWEAPYHERLWVSPGRPHLLWCFALRVSQWSQKEQEYGVAGECMRYHHA